MSLGEVLAKRIDENFSIIEPLKNKSFKQPISYFYMKVKECNKDIPEIHYELTKIEFNSISDIIEFEKSLVSWEKAHTDPTIGDSFKLSKERSIWEDIVYAFVSDL